MKISSGSKLLWLKGFFVYGENSPYQLTFHVLFFNCSILIVGREYPYFTTSAGIANHHLKKIFLDFRSKKDKITSEVFVILKLHVTVKRPIN